MYGVLIAMPCRKAKGIKGRARGGQKEGGMHWALYRPLVTDTAEIGHGKLQACAVEMARIAGDDEIIKVSDLHDLRLKHTREIRGHGNTGKVGLDLLGRGPGKAAKNVTRKQISEMKDSRTRAQWCSKDYEALTAELRKVISRIRASRRSRFDAEPHSDQITQQPSDSDSASASGSS